MMRIIRVDNPANINYKFTKVTIGDSLGRTHRGIH